MVFASLFFSLPLPKVVTSFFFFSLELHFYSLQNLNSLFASFQWKSVRSAQSHPCSRLSAGLFFRLCSAGPTVTCGYGEQGKHPTSYFGCEIVDSQPERRPGGGNEKRTEEPRPTREPSKTLMESFPLRLHRAVLISVFFVTLLQCDVCFGRFSGRCDRKSSRTVRSKVLRLKLNNLSVGKANVTLQPCAAAGFAGLAEIQLESSRQCGDNATRRTQSRSISGWTCFGFCKSCRKRRAKRKSGAAARLTWPLQI